MATVMFFSKYNSCMRYKLEVLMWLAEARKRKLQVGNSTGNCKGLRRWRGNRKRTLGFLKGI